MIIFKMEVLFYFLLRPEWWPGSFIGNWRSSICFERNFKPRSETIVSNLNKLELLLSILLTVLFPKTPLLTKVQSIRMEDVAKTIFLIRFFSKKKTVCSSFQREIPCSKPLTAFFSSITASIDQSSVISTDGCSSNFFFFFWQRNPININ